MSSFFTLPASQRKRKRDDTTDPPNAKRKPSASRRNTKPRGSKPSKRDQSISSEASEDEGKPTADDGRQVASSDESQDDDETGAERRLRLAEQYLENIKGEVDEAGFDAEDIDRDLIAARLQADVVGDTV